MVGKWWWRFFSNEGRFWVKLIKGVYGPDRGWEEDRPVKIKNSVRGGVLRVLEDLNKVGVHFSSSFGKEVGSGAGTSFWEHRWLGNFLLKNRFSRLYNLETEKEVTISSLGAWRGEGRYGNGVGTG